MEGWLLNQTTFNCITFNLIKYFTKNSVVVWNVQTKESICGSPAQHKSAGITFCLCASRDNDNMFFTGGK